MNGQKGKKRIVFDGQGVGLADSQSTSTRNRSTHRYIYLLSPAFSAGRRAQMLVNPQAEFELARRLRTSGILLAEAFVFMSPLYFRGKLAYAAVFSRETAGIPGTLLITPSRGLLPPETVVGIADLQEICGERIVAKNPKYTDPLERDLRALSATIGQDSGVVLLGSIATTKYVPLLVDALGERLFVPHDFIGLGNMSRGALLLRCSREKSELKYVRVTEVLRREQSRMKR
ncbi:MAG: hypothetical protein WBR26_14495 [Candidatus Acidiferrum sp.]